MKKLLMICYYYPPLVDVGSLRSIAFSQNLSIHGWAPTVLTVSNPCPMYCRVGNTVPPEEIPVFRALSLFNPLPPLYLANAAYDRLRKVMGFQPSNAFFDWALSLWLPDFFAPWIPGAIFTAMNLKENDFDAIYASCSPFSSAVIGLILKELFQKPLILDFRDPMTKRIFQLPETFFDLVRQRIEHRVLQHCDHLILLTEESRSRYVKTYPFLHDKVSVIHNGYDDSFAQRVVKSRAKNTRFTLTYSGAFYENMVSPEPFFDALRFLLNSKWIPEEKILFRYVGRPGSWFDRLVKERELQEVIEVTGYVPHEQVKNYVSESDVILLRSGHPCCLSTKLYEGLSLGKPFIALTEPGEAAELLEKHAPDSIIARPMDEKGIACGMKHLYDRWEKDLLDDQVSEEYLEAFSWNNLTVRLVEILDGVCSKPWQGGNA